MYSPERSRLQSLKEARPTHSNSIPRVRFFASLWLGLHIRMSQTTTVFALGLLFALSCSFPCAGQQTTGSISGTVRDTSGAVIPQVPVTASNTGTGVKTKAISDADGFYTFFTLATGDYTIAAEKAGFNPTTLSGITLQVYQKAVIDITLKVGSQMETVNIESKTPLVDVSTASLGTEVDERSIQDLPLNLRQVGALALTVPGTVDSTGRSLTSATGNGSGFNDSSFSGVGGYSGSNVLLIDGMISRALNNGSFALNPPPEMVKEFKIQTNVYDATFGSTSGAVMNLVTQSGTNAWHGGIGEYLRNRDLDARQTFQTPAVLPVIAQYIRNQFSGSVGGAILKDRLFVFLAYEGLRQSRGATATANVPTAAQKSGDFSSLLTGSTQNLCGGGGPSNLNYDTGQLFDPKTEAYFICPNTGSQILLGTPIPGNIITTFDPVAQKILPLFHAPSGLIEGRAVYVNPTSSRRSDNQYDARIDYDISKNDLLFGRYLLGTSDQFFPGAFDPFNSTQLFRGHNIVGGWTHIFSPTLINDLRIGYQKDYLKYDCQGCPRPAGTIESLGITNLTAIRPDLEEYPNIAFANFATLGDGFPGYYPDIVPDSITKYEDTLTKIVGRHSFTFGFDLNNWNTDGVQDPRQVNGFIDFGATFSNLGGESAAANPAADLADMELGFPSGTPAGFYTSHPIVTQLVGGRWFSLFVQDNFRVNKKLTVEAGLRWERRTQPYDKNNQIAAVYPLANNFTAGDALMLTALPDTQNDALCSNPYFISTISGQCIIMSSSLRKKLGLNSNQVRQVSRGDSHGNFNPRFGVSYSPLDSDKIVLHAGAGIFLDLPETNLMGSFANNNPVFTQTPTYNTVFGAPPPLTNGVPTTTTNIFVNAPVQTIAQTYAQLMPSPLYHTPTVYQWSLSTQSQLAKNTALEVGYIGNKGIHLDYEHVIGNQAKPQPNTDAASIQAARPWPDLGVVNYDSYTGDSNYNALYLKVNQRLTRDLSGLVAYTYAKTLNDNPSNADAAGFGVLPQNDNNPKADYGVSDNSIRHRLVISGIYQLPFGKGRALLSNSGPVVNALIGKWEISTIVVAQTGYPFTVTSQDFSNTGSASPRPDRTCSGVLDKRSPSQWFNPGCFTTADLQTALSNGAPRFGNSGRNILTGPGLVDFDTSLIKRFSMFERLNAEIQVQAFNLFNHPNYSVPDSVLGDGHTGQIFSTVPGGSTGSNREVQIALEVKF
jgi:hypothetical protein